MVLIGGFTLFPGFTMPKLELGLLQRIIMFKLIQGAILCGLIVFSVGSVRGQALLGY